MGNSSAFLSRSQFFPRGVLSPGRSAARSPRVADDTEPRAKTARYDRESRRVIVELLNGTIFMIPVDLIQGLRGACDQNLEDNHP